MNIPDDHDDATAAAAFVWWPVHNNFILKPI